jgi:CheY-like chemotaxis protein
MSVPRILVVDDQPINVQLLRLKLEREGMQVLTAPNGRDALAQAASARPDLILMDLLMPDMDGLTACRQLKADPATREIPVIFLTASPSKEHRQEGRAAGAADYLIKPIDLDETMVRVRLHLRLAQLEHEAAEIAPRLHETRRSAFVGAAAQGVTHHLNNLLGVVLGYVELVRTVSGDPEKVRRYIHNVDDSLQKVIQLVRQLSTVAARARPSPTPATLGCLLAGGVARFHADHRPGAPVSVETDCPDLALPTHREAIEDALARILDNGWEAYPADATERPLRLEARRLTRPGGADHVEFRVLDRGRGVNPDIQDRVCEPFVGTKDQTASGLGLTIARHAVRALGGEISVTPQAGGGTLTVFTHPVTPPTRAS